MDKFRILVVEVFNCLYRFVFRHVVYQESLYIDDRFVY